jgi:hypothetical protein
VNVCSVHCGCMQCPLSRHIHQAVHDIYKQRKIGSGNVGMTAIGSDVQVL